MITDYTPETGDDETAVMELVRSRRRTCVTAETEQRADAEDDIRFAKGKQWPEKARSSRENDPTGARPCLTINKTGQYVRQVVNDARQNSPAIRVFPSGGGADKETAKIFNGIIRDVEQRTDADVAYDTAIESAARAGEGYWRLISRYLDEENGFEQEVAFQRIRNMLTVHLDPAAIDPAGADAKYCFVDEWMSTEEFKEQYGAERMAGLSSQGLGSDAPRWIDGGSILVADYYSVESDHVRTLAMLRGGEQVILEEQKDEPAPENIVAQRKIKTTRVVIRKVSGNSVLEKTVWPCKYIPVFRVIGEEFEVDGQVTFQGLIRPMKDAAQMYNYWVTSATEKGALETKAPYIGAEGQFEGHEQQWRTANSTPYAYLEYKATTTDDGTLHPAPQRSITTFAGQADVQMAGLAEQDIKSTVGIYNAGLGAQSNEKSGRAILARQRESDTGTFHYVDNQALAIEHCGRVLVAVLPKYLSKEKKIRIIGEDDEESMVTINGVQTDDAGKAIGRINDITVGRYDVTVGVGPSYATKRIETAENMMELIRAYPAAAPVLADLLVTSFDFPGADVAGQRLRKMVPPHVLGDDEEDAFTPEQVEVMINSAVENMKAQFDASIEVREVEVKEFDAETKRLKAEVDEIPREDAIREMIGAMLAEFLNDIQSSVQSETQGNAGPQ